MEDLLGFLNFTGLDLGTGKRNIDLKKENAKINEKIPQTVSEYAKFKEIPMEAALQELGDGQGLIPVEPIAKKADTFVEKVKKSGLGLFPMPIQFGGAEYSEQVYDPKLGRLVGKDRPTGPLGALASIADASTFGLTDFDQKGGGLLGSQKSLRGFGGQPTDFKLSKTIKDQLKTEVDEGSTNPVDNVDEIIKAYGDFKKNADKESRKGRMADAALESAVMRANMPFITNTMKDLSTFKQNQLLAAEKVKQSLPNAQQQRLLTADAGFKAQADAIAGQYLAAVEGAKAGAFPRNVSFSA